MSLATRLLTAGRALMGRAVASDYGPFDERADSMWSIVRGQEPSTYTRTGKTIREQGVEANAVVSACVRVIADQIAAVPLEAYRQNAGGDAEALPGSPLQMMLDQPAPQLSGFKWRRQMAAHLVMYGNSYTIIERGARGAPDRLRVVQPERIQRVLVNTDTDEIAGYTWHDSTGRLRTTPWFDVIHAPDLVIDPDGWFGFPRGAAVLLELLTDGDASTYVRQVMNNSGVPSMVMLADVGASMDDLRKAEDVWQERMATRGGRGRARFVGGIKQVQVVGHSLRDLEFPLVRQIGRESICAAFGVDPRLIAIGSAAGKDGGMSGAQYAEARRKLEQQTCAPLRIALQDALDTVLAMEFTDGLVRFAPDDIAALLETPAERADRITVLVGANVLTIEEARKANGYPEAMDPAHHTAAPRLYAVADAQLPPAPAPLALAPGAPAPLVDDTTNARTAPAPKSRAIRLTKAQRAALAATFDARAVALEPAFRDRAAVLFALEAADVSQLLGAANDERHAPYPERRASFYDRVQRAVDDYYAPKGKARETWARSMTPDIALAMGEAAADLSAELGVSFDLANPRVTAAIADRVNKLAGNVAQTTLEQLRVVIAAGRQAGQGPEEIARQIMAAVFDPAITERRALVIARTETVGALNEGEWLAALDAGMQSKAWLDVQDAAVRETHTRNANAGWIAMDATFPDGLLYPHDPNGSAEDVIQCRCSLLFSDLPPADAAADQPMGTP